MKKYKIFILFFILFMVNIKCVTAQTFTCEYKFTEGEVYTFEYDITNSTATITNEKKSSIFGNKDYLYILNFIDNEIKSYTPGECPTLYMTTEMISADFYTQTKYNIYSDPYLREVAGSDCVINQDEVCLRNVLGNYTWFYIGNLTDSETNEENTEVSLCSSYDILETNIENAGKSYKDCTDSSCKINQIKIIKENEQKLKKLCNSMLANRDVIYENEKDEFINDSCIDSCLNISTKLKQLKKDYGIPSGSGKGQCGFSQRLLYWIANIVRWIKYIIPVAVIVLGILDFIKAVGADKDDEMKKAQGRFVKRLIAAALIFIIPFIIEFVLDKMGFGEYISGCGIIDL